MSDLQQLFAVKQALDARGIEALMSTDTLFGYRSVVVNGEDCITIQRRDLVYARWVAAAAGVDTWLEPDQGEDS